MFSNEKKDEHFLLDKAEELLDTTIHILTTLQHQKYTSVSNTVLSIQTSIQFPPNARTEVHLSTDEVQTRVENNERNMIHEDKLDDRYGSLASALLCLVTRVSGLILCCVYMAMPKVYLDGKLKKHYIKVVDFVVHVCTGECCIVIIVSLLLLLGLLLHKKSLLLPWLIVSFFESFCCLIAIIPLVAFSVIEKLWYPVFIWICFMVPLISLHRSCASFVASHYWMLLQKESEANPT